MRQNQKICIKGKYSHKVKYAIAYIAIPTYASLILSRIERKMLFILLFTQGTPADWHFPTTALPFYEQSKIRAR